MNPKLQAVRDKFASIQWKQVFSKDSFRALLQKDYWRGLWQIGRAHV